MSRFSILNRVLLAGALLSAASPGHARGDQADDDRLAKKLAIMASKYYEYQEAETTYGVMAEKARNMN